MGKCIYCGKTLTKSTSKRCGKCYLLHDNPSFSVASRAKMGRRKEKHPFWKGGLPKCKDCGCECSRYDAIRCVKCARKGRLHPNWIDGRGYEDYPVEFTRQLREKIILRDNQKCQGENCTMTREEHYLVYDRDIEVHHIDYNRQNCQETNLITTCKQCNIRANYDRNYWKEFFTGRLVTSYRTPNI